MTSQECWSSWRSSSKVQRGARGIRSFVRPRTASRPWWLRGPVNNGLVWSSLNWLSGGSTMFLHRKYHKNLHNDHSISQLHFNGLSSSFQFQPCRPEDTLTGQPFIDGDLSDQILPAHAVCKWRLRQLREQKEVGQLRTPDLPVNLSPSGFTMLYLWITVRRHGPALRTANQWAATEVMCGGLASIAVLGSFVDAAPGQPVFFSPWRCQIHQNLCLVWAISLRISVNHILIYMIYMTYYIFDFLCICLFCCLMSLNYFNDSRGNVRMMFGLATFGDHVQLLQQNRTNAKNRPLSSGTLSRQN